VPDLGCRVDGAAPSNPFWWCVPEFSGLCKGVHCHAGATVSITEHTLPGLIESCRANCRVVMRRSARIMAAARFNMPGVLAVAGRPARGRSRSSVSAHPDALTVLAHRPTVLLSTAKLPYTAHKRLWMFTSLSCSRTKNSITARCLKRESQTNAILKIYYSSAICRNDSKLGMRAGETSDFKPSKLHFSIFMWGKPFWTTFVE
jgi:hypothetical protein